MQALELVILHPSGLGEVTHGAQRVRIVRGKLRVDGFRRGQHHAGTGQIVEIGRGLGRPDREIIPAHLVRQLDLGVPIGALDQAHQETASGLPAQINKPLDHVARPLLVGLHGQPQTLPAVQFRIAGETVQQFQRNHQPVGFLGIQAEANIVLLGPLGLFQNAGIELLHHPGFLHRQVFGVQGRELDGNTVLQLDRLVASHLANGIDGVEIALMIALGVGSRARALAQHIERAQAPFTLLGPFDRLGDLAPQDEILAHDAHGPHCRRPDHRLTQLLGQALPVGTGILARFRVHIEQAARHHQAQRGGIDQPAFRAAHVLRPGPAGNLLGNQLVGSGSIGDAQQGFRQAHQRQALAIGQAEFLQETVHQPTRLRRGTGRLYQFHGAFMDAGLGRIIQTDLDRQPADQGRFIGEFHRVEVIPAKRFASLNIHD